MLSELSKRRAFCTSKSEIWPASLPVSGFAKGGTGVPAGAVARMGARMPPPFLSDTATVGSTSRATTN